jgi:hypothetical protein
MEGKLLPMPGCSLGIRAEMRLGGWSVRPLPNAISGQSATGRVQFSTIASHTTLSSQIILSSHPFYYISI